VESKQLDKAIKILENNRLGTYREYVSKAGSLEQTG